MLQNCYVHAQGLVFAALPGDAPPLGLLDLMIMHHLWYDFGPETLSLVVSVILLASSSSAGPLRFFYSVALDLLTYFHDDYTHNTRKMKIVHLLRMRT